MELFGGTRSSVENDHALITPDTHVTGPLVGWENAAGAIHVSPALGARFVQYSVELSARAVGGPPQAGLERFLFVLSGEVEISGETASALPAGGYAFIPSGAAHEVRAAAAAKLAVFEKQFEPLPPAAKQPRMVIGNEEEVPGEPFLGDPDARLQTLLPDEPAYDMAVNIFTYQPGATLPQVEIHVMEHGLLMLSGAGVYRLNDRWYPVAAGDVIWMAAYCPQWFVAMGKQPARYIYYKDVNRYPTNE